ncbi:hypothetical protein [Brevibacterium sp. Marseille-P9724]|uniref:hypothetical protein n=1 Tax=Brevibacterium sp. Marseille-P9724 TaxID=2614125 RepID=UPI00125ED301|nr:hypothetical protein [Brevibacterium sp. Marseille-P9724]
MATKFSMEAETLSRLGQRTTVENDDLGSQVRALADAAEPLTGVFNGPAKASFNNFHSRVDEIATALNKALSGIVTSIHGQDTAFRTAAEEGAAAHQSAEGSADFSDETFLNRIGGQA